MCCIFRPRFWAATATLGLAGLFLAFPDAAAAGFAQGVHLCLDTLLPSLFPFFIACGFVSSSVGKKGGFFAALLLSWLGGYAVCAGLVRDLRAREKVGPEQATLLLLLGCCSGPGFVIGSIGGHLLRSVPIGIALYTAQLFANLVCTALLWPLIKRGAFRTENTAKTNVQIAVAQGLPQAITQAVDSCLCVCGTVLFFRMAQCVLCSAFSLSSITGTFLSAFLEISSGCADFAALGGTVALYGLCLCLSGLGASVFVQLQALLNGAASLRALVCCRLLHIPVMAVLTGWGLRFLPGESAVFSSLAPRVIAMSRTTPDTAFVVFLFLCAVLYKMRKKNYNKAIRV